MKILYGIAAVVIGAIIYWIFLTIKAMKDPDVQAASSLRMNINRFRHYQRLYDEYQYFMMEHGAHSVASERKFADILKQIDNPNEWHRYQDYRLKKQQHEFQKELNKFMR